MIEQRYRRLTWPRVAQFSVFIASRSSLWLGDDHLLLVERTGYSEKYKRFFFRDIQAFTIRETKRRLVWNLVLGALLTISALIIWGASSDSSSVEGAIIAGSIVGAIFGIPLVVNSLLGPTCACEIRTAVQTEKLFSLCRLRKTRKVMNRIRPLIIAAQGQLTGEETAARRQEAAPAPIAATAPVGDIPPLIS
jgi:hypothetical protein